MTILETQETSDSSLNDKVKVVLSKKAEKELVDYCNTQFTKAKNIRRNFERQWYVNLAFYFGRQYVQWSSTAIGSLNRLYEPAVPPWRVRLVSNKIKPVVRAELAKITKEKPRGFVIPTTTDDADRAAARAAEMYVDYFWREKNLFRNIRRAEFWNVICGTSFMKDWYDPNRKCKDGAKGDVMIEPTSPFHVYILEAQEEELENQPLVIHSMAKSPDWVSQVYKKDLPATSNAGAGILEQQFLQAIGINSGAMNNYVTVKEGWFKPCKKFPNGAVVVWANEELLYLSEKWPYNHGEFPFAKYEHIPTGRFYTGSTIDDLINLQKEWNKTRSQLIEAKNKMAKPQLVAQLGSLNVNKLTSEPGLVIEVKPGFQYPKPLELAQIPQYVIEELDRIQQDFDNISSQHEITRGQTPPGVSAATAISFLQEQDDSKLAYTVASMEDAIEKTTRHILSHVSQFWSAQRQIQITGANDQFEALMFGQADLRGNVDFRIETGSATPVSKAAKQAFIMDLVDKQIIPGDQALKYLDMGETARLYEELQIDARAAQRENMKMAMGMPLLANTWDNDEIHLMELDKYRKSQEFESKPDEIKMIFEQHAQYHQMRIAQKNGMPLPPGDPNLSNLPVGGDPNAIPVGGPAQAPMGETPGNSTQMV